MGETNSKTTFVGWIYLVLFFLFVLGGILVKRVWNHAEFVTVFHLPAALFLVLSGYDLTRRSRERYREACARMERESSAKETGK